MFWKCVLGPEIAGEINKVLNKSNAEIKYVANYVTNMEITS